MPTPSRNLETGTPERLDLGAFLEQYKGGISAEEGLALARYAREAGPGALVEVGSYRGKSSVALAHGLLSGPLAAKKHLHCVDPHAPFVGVYGGQFGPEDRAAFFRVMLETGYYACTSLINLPSTAAAKSFHEPISLLFLDGDHSYEAVAADVESWITRVTVGGFIALDDATDPKCGVRQCVQELVALPAFRLCETVGKVAFVQKMADVTVRSDSAPRRRCLVFCEQPVTTGGLLRFVHLKRALRHMGHDLAFVCLDPTPDAGWAEDVDLLSFADAAAQRWDVTMVPGAGFSAQAIDQLTRLRQDNFGIRVQHVLNSPARRTEFARVNHRLRPHVVVFNNRHWEAGSYTSFQADRFYTLEGAVDAARFAPAPLKGWPAEGGPITLAGQASKNAGPLIGALRSLPEHFRLELIGPSAGVAEAAQDLIDAGRLRLLGHVPNAQLPALYHAWDAVIHTEEVAGWANIVAEAMASGVPVICTEAGTLALADHGETALVLNETTATAIATHVTRLFGDPALARTLTRNARERTESLDWSAYAESLMRMVFDDRGAHYVNAPQLGMHGKWPIAYRMHGLDPLLERVGGKRMLDVGCAEGIVARICCEQGAASVLGFELNADRVEKARELCSPFRQAVFHPADLSNWSTFYAAHGTGIDLGIDITLHLGLQQHLPPGSRMRVLSELLTRTRELLVFRCPRAVFDADRIADVAAAHGFALSQHLPASADAPFGDTWYFERTERASVTPLASASASLAPPSSTSTSASTSGAPTAMRASSPLAMIDTSIPRQFVSYPKSGRTWLRYALTTLGLSRYVTFQHDGFEFNSAERPPHSFDLQARRNKYRNMRVVYLERDPRDLMLSLYHQVTGRFQDFFHYDGTLSEFLRDDYFGAENLHRFRRMWNQLCDEGVALKVSYESCHDDFPAALGAATEHLGLPATREQLLQAEEAAHIDNMRAVEKEGAFPEPWLRPRNGHPKVRDGQVGGHREAFTEDDLSYLNGIFEQD